MEVRFLGTTGTLSDKLMAALQGAKVPGADTRCLADGRSSISAFLRVAKPEDTTGVLFLHLNVNNAPVSVDPIDSLQVLYDDWKGTTHIQDEESTTPDGFALFQNYPNPFNPKSEIRFRVGGTGRVSLTIHDLLGREVAVLLDEEKGPGTYSVTWDAEAFASGVYYYRLRSGGFVETRKLVLLR